MSGDCYHGSCYAFGDTAVFSQTEAENECQRMGMHLVAIETEDENAYLLGKLSQNGTVLNGWYGYHYKMLQLSLLNDTVISNGWYMVQLSLMNVLWLNAEV